MKLLRRAEGLTLIELVSSLAIAALVVSSLYLLLSAVIRGRFIVHARVSDQERARQAMAWLADRVRQVNYDADRPCPEGFLVIGTGNGFGQRLAFHAILEDRSPPGAPPDDRLRYVYYVENQTLYQETRPEEVEPCTDEVTTRTAPDPSRIALTPPIVQSGGGFVYLDRDGNVTADRRQVHSLRITMTVEAASAAGRPPERQTYQTVVSLRGP
ncbi:MAG: hypothetical protein QN183_03890 [Armatimonadota bacterium]|nr:hypothetical protein [Armatimonadota bacterium]MDR7484980.1 hypothetical protein [Armatimonadota bacterium]MDR7533719.1 hypothetical protein [Armatimonadota bacterium]MDR7535494.1 hypothetical protein [Armatimonadota bacterium]